MPLPATVAHLDVDAVADVLINHHANIRNAARALNVPSGDLRKSVLLDERLSAAAVEAIELKLDVAEANLHEALGSEDPRRRDVVSMFFLRHTQRAAKRGYAVPALGVEANAEPARAVRYTIRWANEPVDDRAEPDDSDDTVVRDGKRLIIPKYGAREGDFDRRLRRGTFSLDRACRRYWGCGEPGSRRAACCRARARARPPRSVTSASASPPGFAPGLSLIRWPSACAAASQSSWGRRGRKFRTARRERAFIGPATPNGVLSGKRRRGRRLGSRPEPFRSERSRWHCHVAMRRARAVYALRIFQAAATASRHVVIDAARSTR